MAIVEQKHSVDVYTFIHDRNLVDEFEQKYLMDDESYLILLAFREKYCEEKKKYQLKNTFFCRQIFVKKPEKLTLYSFLKRHYEIEEFYDDNGQMIPPHLLSLYMTVSPRNKKSAILEFNSKIVECLANQQDFRSIDSLYKTCLHRHEKQKYIQLDIDDKQNISDVLDDSKSLEIQVSGVIETKNGYHVLIDISALQNPTQKEFIFRASRKLYPKLEVKKHGVVPIPGTFQAGFKVVLKQ